VSELRKFGVILNKIIDKNKNLCKNKALRQKEFIEKIRDRL
jgi:hypothetical protein